MSPGLVAVISIPFVLLSNVKVPNVPELSTDKTIKPFVIEEPTIKVEFTVVPPVKVMSAVPRVSPTLIFDKFSEPASDVKTEVAISVSPTSWLTSMLKSDN